eukprot:scaffold325_cov230-Pinguiococcus_pyrenoidosus.AAC.12
MQNDLRRRRARKTTRGTSLAENCGAGTCLSQECRRQRLLAARSFHPAVCESTTNSFSVQAKERAKGGTKAVPDDVAEEAERWDRRGLPELAEKHCIAASDETMLPCKQEEEEEASLSNWPFPPRSEGDSSAKLDADSEEEHRTVCHSRHSSASVTSNEEPMLCVEDKQPAGAARAGMKEELHEEQSAEKLVELEPRTCSSPSKQSAKQGHEDDEPRIDLEDLFANHADLERFRNIFQQDRYKDDSLAALQTRADARYPRTCLVAGLDCKA